MKKKITVHEAVASVKNAPGSMFTREDVLSLLNSLDLAEDTPAGEFVGLDKEQIEALVNIICEKIQGNAERLDASDVVDFNSAEFALSGNEIELDGIDINSSCIEDEVARGIGDIIEEFFEELGKEKA